MKNFLYLLGKEESVIMLKPDAYFEKITDISLEFLKEHNIKGIILDVDNTILDLDKVPINGIEDWVNIIKKNDIELCIASNSINKEKLNNISKKLNIPYISRSLKPMKLGLKKATNIMNVKAGNIAEIGDQLFTDVLGANRMKMFSILVKPISKEKHFINEIKRKIEKKILKKHKIL